MHELLLLSVNVIAEVTIPVGTAIIEYPIIIIIAATAWPRFVSGEMSPYPTVVRVTMDQ
jgi:hypothetical protein